MTTNYAISILDGNIKSKPTIQVASVQFNLLYNQFSFMTKQGRKIPYNWSKSSKANVSLQ